MNTPHTTPSSPSMLTTRQASELLGVSVRRVQALVSSGRLKAELFGHVWMVRSADLARLKPGQPGRPKKGSKTNTKKRSKT